VNFADLKFPIVNEIIFSTALVLGILFIAAMPRRDMQTADGDAIEFPLLLLLMLIVTPLSYGYFYSWLMLPFAVITQRVLIEKVSSILWWCVPALALLAVGLIFPRGAQLYGNTFFATLLLFIGLSIQRFSFKQKAGRSHPVADFHRRVDLTRIGRSFLFKGEYFFV
jgi:hypothetical protein